MELNNHQPTWKDKIDLLAGLHDKYINRINQIMMIQAELIKDNFEELGLIIPIWRFIDHRLNTVVQLVEKWLLWDVEIIYRSAIEASLKLIKIVLLDTDQNIPTNIEEFWISFSEVNSLKRSDKAREILSECGEYLDPKYKELLENLCLDESNERALREMWTRQVRSTLNSNWTFNKIVRELKETTIIPDDVKPLILLLSYQYQLSSNIIHGDESGIMFEITRDTQNILNDPMNPEHFAKLLIETTLLYATVSLMTSIYVGQHHQTSKIKDIIIQIVSSKKEDDSIIESINMESL